MYICVRSRDAQKQLAQTSRSDQKLFKWSFQCEQHFDKAKDLLLSSHVLNHYDQSLPVLLESVASHNSVGAVILHRCPEGDQRPITYASTSLNSYEKSYNHIEKESLNVIFSITNTTSIFFGEHSLSDKRVLSLIFDGWPLHLYANLQFKRLSEAILHTQEQAFHGVRLPHVGFTSHHSACRTFGLLGVPH